MTCTDSYPLHARRAPRIAAEHEDAALTRPRVHLDLPDLDPQMIDETDRPWMFVDEAPDPSVVVPGAVLVAGEPGWPLLVRVVDVTGAGSDRLVHADVLGCSSHVI